MSLDSIMLSERSQTQKTTSYVIPLMIAIDKSIEREEWPGAASRNGDKLYVKKHRGSSRRGSVVNESD